MKILSFAIVLLAGLFLASCAGKTQKKETVVEKNQVELKLDESNKKVDVMIDGDLFTSYRWDEGVYKPVLYPVIASSGTMVTRGFPLDPKVGERADHRHHVGNWMNYGNVNGFDFWGNGHTGQKSENGGEIIHLKIGEMKAEKNKGMLSTSGKWVDVDGNQLMEESTTYQFIAREDYRIIDRSVKLTATQDVKLNDTKEGMFAIRVARQLELPSDGKITIVDESGEPKRLEKASTEGITGNYLSSEGVSGSDVWGTRAKWVNLFGDIKGEKISIAICDHPENINYPTYWHARGYGLFSANPLGLKDFTKGEQELNLSLEPGESISFKYRLVICSGKHLSKVELDGLTDEFAKK